MTIANVLNTLEDNFGCADPGHVYDFDIIKAGTTATGLDHNGRWVRIIALDKHTLAYAIQDDSIDGEFSLGSISDAAEFIRGEIDCEEE